VDEFEPLAAGNERAAAAARATQSNVLKWVRAVPTQGADLVVIKQNGLFENHDDREVGAYTRPRLGST
jgi:hypothetical protein